MSPRDDVPPPGFEPHTEAGPERRPLYRETPPAPPFPVAALGALRPAADAITALTQAPAALCAQGVLAAASLAVCPHFDVELPQGAVRPTAMLFVSIASSGERKTAVDGFATAPIRTREAELAAADEGARRQYWADREAWGAATAAVKEPLKKSFTIRFRYDSLALTERIALDAAQFCRV